MSERLLFKFYKSYFDLFNELKSDKEKSQFITAILNKQFYGIEPDLNQLSVFVKFAYISQKHSIDKQVKGFEDKVGTKLCNPIQYPTVGGAIDPKQQLQLKEEIEVEVKEEYTIPEYSEFKEYAISKKPDVSNINLKLKYDAWIENGWKDGNDRKIKNWKSKLLNTIKYLGNEKNERHFKADSNQRKDDGGFKIYRTVGDSNS